MPGDRRLSLFACSLALALLGVGPSSAAAGHSAKASAGGADGRYIVTYRASGAHAVPASRVTPETAVRERTLGFDADTRYRSALKGFSARLSSADVRALEADPEVALVSPDRAVHALADVPVASGELVPAGLRRLGAATFEAVRGASSAAVAVLDTGVDLDHPDLLVEDGVNCTGAGPADDDHGHGTHVAGTIAARNDGAGVVGVAPGTRIFAVKVLDANGSGDYSDILCGIDWVTANAAVLGIGVANMSLGGLGSYSTCSSEPLHLAVCSSTAAGVLYTVAAGNDGWDLGAAPPDVPAWYPEVLTVTAMADSDGRAGATGAVPSCLSGEIDDSRASFSNYSTAASDNAHSIAAPGVCVRSTVPGGGYATMSGTSMAAPHIAGAVALCLGEGGASGPCTGLAPAQIIDRMRADAAAHATATNGFSGDPLQPLGSRWYGHLSWLGPSDSVAETPSPAPVPTPASAPAASPVPPAPTCTVRRSVRRHRHTRVLRRHGHKRKRVVRIHRHVRYVRTCR
jgi:subtilisin